ncbi:MAG TPA: RimK family alpha-L-glutamate ligase [Polyangia bacterium]|jgi:ribosomal protein S6--L-glutamate ligase|nr:RimK family alpha-L-glutamate ligase [Polyangia bacterium]
MRRIGIISAHHDEDWHAQRFALAAAHFGRVDVIAPTDFAADVRQGAPRVTIAGVDCREYDLLLTPRALGDEGDADVQLELYRVLATSGVRLVNDVGSLLVAIDKFRTSWELARAGIPTPAARVVQTATQARTALAALGEAVAKPLFGSLGRGVEAIAIGGDARALELLAERGALYLQVRVADVQLDLRLFVIGDHVEAAIARLPRAGDFRGNFTCDAEQALTRVDDDVARVAVAACHAVGLDYAGVDLVVGARGPEVIEVNGTPSFRAIYELGGRDMAPAIVAYAVDQPTFTQSGAERVNEQSRQHERA